MHDGGPRLNRRLLFHVNKWSKRTLGGGEEELAYLLYGLGDCALEPF